MALTDVSRIVAAAERAELAASRAIQYAEASDRLQHSWRQRMESRLAHLEAMVAALYPEGPG